MSVNIERVVTLEFLKSQWLTRQSDQDFRLTVAENSILLG